MQPYLFNNMNTHHLKTFEFKKLPIGIEVKDLRVAKELPNLLGRPHKATFYQMVWIDGGEAAFRIDFRKITIPQNQLLVIAAGQVCEFDVVSEYSGKLILFTPAFFAATDADANFLHTSELLNPVNLNASVAVSPRFADTVISLLDEELKRGGDNFQTAMAQSYLRVLLLEAERQLTSPHFVSPANTLAREFYNAVERHFRENRNADFYTRLLGVNEKTLSREVKSLSGKTPKVYIDARVLLEAKRLLAYSALSVKEIGYGLGFDEPTNFNKYFRKHTGVTPSQFRKSTKK